jgi:outer membrane protein OmpA-like peptidoglycan-associated protein
MGVLDTAKPFHRIEIYEPSESEPKYVVSPNIFLDTEKPSNSNQVGEIYLTSLNIVLNLDSTVNICELDLKHEPNHAPAIEMDSMVKVYLGYYAEDFSAGPEYSLVFTGYITRQKVHLRQTYLECKSRLNKIITLRKKMTFSKLMTFDELIKKLAIDEGNLELASNGITTSNISRLPGYGISEQRPMLDHIESLAKFNGFNIFMDINDKFHAAGWESGTLNDNTTQQNGNWLDARGKDESENSDYYKHLLTFGKDIIEADFELSAPHLSTVEITGFISASDDLTHTIEPPVVEFTPEDGSDPDLPKKIFKISHVTREDAEKIAENLYWRINQQLIGKLKILGSPQVRLGDGIKITGEVNEIEPFQNFDFAAGSSSGENLGSIIFQVTKINHKFNNTDGFISLLNLAETHAAVGTGETGEEAPEEEEEETEETPEEEEGEEEEAPGEEDEEGEEEEVPGEEEPEEEDERTEIEYLTLSGVNFNFDSAVVLTRDLGDIKGIIKMVNETDGKVLIAGHTDRSGPDDYNLNLSALRAKSVLAICSGDTALWNDVIDEGKWLVEDYQAILKDFGLYEGEIDGIVGPKTRKAVTYLQGYYNDKYDKAIAVDGIMGPQTWEAIFTVMVDLIGTEIDSSKYGDVRWIGCGEFRPIEEPETDNLRSEKNRRVEFLIYPEDKFPSISPPYASRAAMEAAYNDVEFKFTEISFDDTPLDTSIVKVVSGTLNFTRIRDYNTGGDLPAADQKPFPIRLVKFQFYIPEIHNRDIEPLSEGETDEDGKFSNLKVLPMKRAVFHMNLEDTKMKYTFIRGIGNVNLTDHGHRNKEVVWVRPDIEVVVPEGEDCTLVVKASSANDYLDMFNSIYRIQKHMEDHASAQPKCEVRVPANNLTNPADRGTYEWKKRIYLLESDILDRDVIFHEYGHLVHEITYGTIRHPGYQYAWSGSVDSHGKTREHFEASWMEGWATYLCDAVQNDPDYHDEEGAHDIRFDAEAATAANIIGAHSEESCTKVLWNIFVKDGEDKDKRFENFKKIWEVFSGAKPHVIFEFYDNWKSMGKGDLDKVKQIFIDENMEYKYTWLEGTARWTARDGLAAANETTREFGTVDQLFEVFGVATGESPSATERTALRDQYREEFFNTNNNEFRDGANAPGGAFNAPTVSDGERYVVPVREPLDTS